MPLVTSISLAVNATLSAVADLNVVPKSALAFSKLVELATGTGAVAGVADKMFFDRRTLAPSATEDLDLVGVLLDSFGTAISFARVKGIFVSAVAANANNVIVGAASATQWATLLNATGTVTLRPGATFAAFSGVADTTGYAAVGGASDLLKVANSGAGTSVDYDIVVIGAGT